MKKRVLRNPLIRNVYLKGPSRNESMRALAEACKLSLDATTIMLKLIQAKKFTVLFFLISLRHDIEVINQIHSIIWSFAHAILVQ
jgi:hypothetical protein